MEIDPTISVPFGLITISRVVVLALEKTVNKINEYLQILDWDGWIQKSMYLRLAGHHKSTTLAVPLSQRLEYQLSLKPVDET